MVVDGTWEVDDFLNECEIFPDGEHDDQIDAAAGAMNLLTKMPSFGLNIEGTNQAFKKENDWRPQGVSSDTMDLTGKVGGERITEARQAQAIRDQQREIEQAFAM